MLPTTAASGKITETLPDGFSYVADSASPSAVRVADDGHEVGFTLLSVTTFSYKVMASRTGGSHTFMGTLLDDAGTAHTISGLPW